MKSIDVVYVLGSGSKWNNTEIRFSLRSICKNLKNFRNVVIVGERPDFLQGVVHVPADDIFNPNENADGNIITKVLAACNDERVSDDFLFINDDHLVLQPMNVEDVPPLHKGDMMTFDSKYWESPFWRKRLKRTMQVLVMEHYPAMHYDCHTPILFNKRAFKEVVSRFNYQEGIGYTMKSLYGNLVYKDNGLELTTEKKVIFKRYTLKEIYERLQGAMFMSFNDDGLNDSLRWWLIENFSSKCRYEKDRPVDRVFDIYFWTVNGMKYSQGVEVFCRWFKHRNMIEMLRRGETQTLRDKLEYKLTHAIEL